MASERSVAGVLPGQMKIMARPCSLQQTDATSMGERPVAFSKAMYVLGVFMGAKSPIFRGNFARISAEVFENQQLR
jgi:hypothetical protein